MQLLPFSNVKLFRKAQHLRNANLVFVVMFQKVEQIIFETKTLFSQNMFQLRAAFLNYCFILAVQLDQITSFIEAVHGLMRHLVLNHWMVLHQVNKIDQNNRFFKQQFKQKTTVLEKRRRMFLMKQRFD